METVTVRVAGGKHWLVKLVLKMTEEIGPSEANVCSKGENALYAERPLCDQRTLTL